MPPLPPPQSDFIQTYLGVEIPPHLLVDDTPPPVTDDANKRLLEMTAEELAEVDLTLGDMDEIFSKEAMLALKKKEFPFADDPSLKEIMKRIDKGLSEGERTETLIQLAGILGEAHATMETHYDRFLVLKKQQDAIGDAGGHEEVPKLDNDRHEDFMASRGQLLFGAVLADAFGIHEVFAALLSSTGGLVGPGNDFAGPIKALHLDSNNPVSLHGTVHDAAGYLKNYHKDGPGYNYRESPLEVLSSDNPLAGQHSGIAFWVDDAAREAVTEEIKDSLQAYVDAADFAALAVGDAHKAVEKAGDAAKQKALEMEKAVMKAADEKALAVEKAAEKAAEDAKQSAKAGAKAVGKAADDAADAVGDAADAAAGKIRKMTAGTDAEFVGDAAEAAADVVGDAADAAADGLKYAAEKTADAAGFVAEKTADVASGAADVAADVVKFTADTAEDVVSLAADVAEKTTEMAAHAAEFAADTFETVTDKAAELTGYLSGKVAGAVTEIPLKLGVDLAAGLSAAKTKAMDAVEAVKSGFSWFTNAFTEPAPKPGEDPVEDSKAVSAKAKEKRGFFSKFMGF